MRAKKDGYARQQQCRHLGIHPTATATDVRLTKREMKMRSVGARQFRAGVHDFRNGPSHACTDPAWKDPVQIRQQREAEAACFDRGLARQERFQPRRGW